MTLTYIAPAVPRRALSDCERRIGLLEDALSRPAPEITEAANRAELARLRDLLERHALEVERIREQRIAFTGRRYRIHRAIADKHYREHLELLEEAGHVRREEGAA